MNFFIQVICAGAINYAMCTTSLQQAALQTGATDMYGKFAQYTEHKVQKELDPYENQLRSYADDIVRHIDKNLILVVGVTYKIYNDRGLVFTLHPRFASDIACEVHPNSVGIKIKWVY